MLVNSPDAWNSGISHAASRPPKYLKVINESGGKIFVDMTRIIPLGAEMSKGACELYGLPIGNHSITIENHSGPGSRDVDFDLSGGETFEVVVDKIFF